MSEAVRVRGADHAMRRFEEVDREYGWSGDVVAAATFVLALVFRDLGTLVVLGGALPAASHLIRRAVIRGRSATFRWAQANTLIGAAAICAGSLGTGGLWSPVLGFAPLVGVIATIVYPHQRRWVWLSPGIVAIVATPNIVVGLPDNASPFQAICTAVVALAIPRYVNDFVAVEVRQRDRAAIDPLTGCLNRSTLQERFDELSNDATVADGVVSVVTFDIDRFKRINDHYGHSVGDEVLQMLSATVRTTLDESSMLFRLGGEEFLVIRAASEPTEAQELGERIRAAVEVMESPAGAVTVSVGTTVARRWDHLDGVVHQADHAMLRAKQQGRNRTQSVEHLS